MYTYPPNQIKKVEYLFEIQKPISFSLEDIKLDMYRYAKEFKKESIPHISERGEIVDNIHNYPKPPKQEKMDSPSRTSTEKKKTANLLEHGRPTLTEKDIDIAKKEI